MKKHFSQGIAPLLIVAIIAAAAVIGGVVFLGSQSDNMEDSVMEKDEGSMMADKEGEVMMEGGHDGDAMMTGFKNALSGTSV